MSSVTKEAGYIIDTGITQAIGALRALKQGDTDVDAVIADLFRAREAAKSMARTIEMLSDENHKITGSTN